MAYKLRTLSQFSPHIFKSLGRGREGESVIKGSREEEEEKKNNDKGASQNGMNIPLLCLLQFFRNLLQLSNMPLVLQINGN